MIAVLIAVLIAVAALVVAAPMVAALVVSSGCRREDARWGLVTPAHGRVETTARRIVAIDPDRVRWPRPKDGAAAQAPVTAWNAAGTPDKTSGAKTSTGAQAALIPAG
ncbi:MAG TPA: hypothetical protein VGI58_15370 [Streptosporangiaceae bacterium]|jgi:hypothetical protein